MKEIAERLMMSWADQSWMFPEGRVFCYKRYRVAQGVHRPAPIGCIFSASELGACFAWLAFRNWCFPGDVSALGQRVARPDLLIHETRRGSFRGAFETASSGGSGTRSQPRARFRLASTLRAPAISLLV